MTELRVGDQTIRFDREATASVYTTVDRGGAEECGCVFCKNFAAQRTLVYPDSFSAVLHQLGIDPDKEGEVYECGPSEDGSHLYGGWFYLVGEMVTAGERNSVAAGAPQFEFWFTSSFPKSPAFRDGPVLAIEFATRLKWVLPDSPE